MRKIFRWIIIFASVVILMFPNTKTIASTERIITLYLDILPAVENQEHNLSELCPGVGEDMQIIIKNIPAGISINTGNEIVIENLGGLSGTLSRTGLCAMSFSNSENIQVSIF